MMTVLGGLFGGGVVALLYSLSMISWIEFCNLPHGRTPDWTVGLLVVLTVAGVVIGAVVGYVFRDQI